MIGLTMTRFELNHKRLEEHFNAFKSEIIRLPVNIKFDDNIIRNYTIIIAIGDNEYRIFKDGQVMHEKFNCITSKEITTSINKYFNNRQICDECDNLHKVLLHGVCEDCNESNLYTQRNIDKACSICMEDIKGDLHVTKCKHNFS